MSAEAIITVGAAVVTLVQLLKWMNVLSDAWGPVGVLVLSALGVLVWLFSQEVWPPARTDAWAIFAGWIAVSTSAAGVFGFTRAAASTVTRMSPPPSTGAGSEKTAP